eukprot:m51a1_g7728 putative mapk phosphatase 2 (156) ;mRNA; r:157475-158257
MDPIAPGLWLGARSASLDGSLLRSAHITHILQVADEFVPARHKGVTVKVLPADDRPAYNIRALFPAAERFIDSALQSGGNILVHCAAGYSRSPTIVIAYLMKKRCIGLCEAIAAVRRCRCVSPNCGFMSQLLAWEHELDDQRAAASAERLALSSP